MKGQTAWGGEGLGLGRAGANGGRRAVGAKGCGQERLRVGGGEGPRVGGE